MIQSHTTALTNSKAGFFFFFFFLFFFLFAHGLISSTSANPCHVATSRTVAVMFLRPFSTNVYRFLPIDRDVSVVSPADSGSSSVLCSIEIQHAETCLTYVIHHVQSRRMLLYNAVQVCARDRSWFWNIQIAVKLEIVKSFTWPCILGRMALFSPGSGRTTCYSNIWTAFF